MCMMALLHLAPACQQSMAHAPTSDVVAADDYLNLLAMPALTPVHTTDGPTTTGPSAPQHVRDVMARVLIQQQQKVSATPACAPTAVPLAAQVGRGPVAEAIARHLTVQAERNEAARVAA